MGYGTMDDDRVRPLLETTNRDDGERKKSSINMDFITKIIGIPFKAILISLDLLVSMQRST